MFGKRRSLYHYLKVFLNPLPLPISSSIWLSSNAKIIIFLIIFTLITKWLITPIEREEKISSRERRTEMEVRETNQREKGALGFFGGWIGS